MGRTAGLEIYKDYQIEVSMGGSGEETATVIPLPAKPSYGFEILRGKGVAEAERAIDSDYVVIIASAKPPRRGFFLSGRAGGMTHDLAEAERLPLREAIGLAYGATAKPAPGARWEIIGYMEAGPGAQRWLDGKFPLPRKKLSGEERLAVYAKFGGRCAYCGRPITIKEMQADHFLPHVGAGGGDEMSNLVPACRDCNRLKSNLAIEGFRAAVAKAGSGNGSQLGIRIARAYGLDKSPDEQIVFFFEAHLSDVIDLGQATK
jgi:hypothetical protein